MGEGASDVVVIGAGSAGCVVAARLAADPRRKVVLIESGGDPSAKRSTREATRSADFFQAAAHPDLVWGDLRARRSSGQSETPYLRGRALGGSSVVNAMVAIPGHPDDYERWVRLGAHGWGWKQVAPWLALASRRLGVRRSRADERGDLSRALLREMGPRAEVVGLTRDVAGRRVSAFDAYLHPQPANVRIESGRSAVAIETVGRRATGIVLDDGRVLPSACVVVCAGAIHSPALLLASGIGRDGVGRHLCDHPAVSIPIALRQPVEAGRLAVSVLARLSSGVEPDDIQWLALDHFGTGALDRAAVLVALMTVRARGSVTLGASGDPRSPLVDFNMLSVDEDADRLLVGAVSAVDRLAGSRAIAAIGTVETPDLSPEGIRRHLGDYVHAAGTCRMGRADHPDAVVDGGGKLHDWEGVWVVDASVMPDLPRANTHLPTVMIAERLSAGIAERLAVR